MRSTSTAENSKTLSVPEAGRLYFNLSRNGSYAAAQRGELPTIRVGRLLRVPVRALEQRLEAIGASERNQGSSNRSEGKV